jgi:hypothetical protein
MKIVDFEHRTFNDDRKDVQSIEPKNVQNIRLVKKSVGCRLSIVERRTPKKGRST